MGTLSEIETIVVVGAGVGGLTAALDLAASGRRVLVLERAPKVGGKMREVEVDGRKIDSGPTVMTMSWVFEELFARAGRKLSDYVSLRPLEVSARHAWPDGSQLDLFTDLEASVAAITRFAGPESGAGYRRFCRHTERIYGVVEQPFIRATRPRVLDIVGQRGLRGALDFMGVDWHRSMWRALGEFFPEPHLRQLFGRYATYYGSSPFECPATLNLIAHVERIGVWRVEGGMYRLAEAMRALAEELGVEFRTDSEVEEVLAREGRVVGVRTCAGQVIPAASVVVNAAPQALRAGKLGREARRWVPAVRERPRSLSAVTWSMIAKTSGFDLHYHNVFFSRDYPAEFADLGAGRLPQEPTVYICAQDRAETGALAVAGEPERLLVLINAPARGDERPLSADELGAAERASFKLLRECGLEIERVDARTTTPSGFEGLFPATGGALYGLATHGWAAPFQRPSARTKLPGLYLAGGGVHPGAGVPMAGLSGHLAAQAALEDLAGSSGR